MAANNNENNNQNTQEQKEQKVVRLNNFISFELEK